MLTDLLVESEVFFNFLLGLAHDGYCWWRLKEREKKALEGERF